MEDFDLVEDDIQNVEVDGTGKQPVEVTAEDLADEEWGPVKDKKKDKKGKSKKKTEDLDEDASIPSEFILPKCHTRSHCLSDGAESIVPTSETTKPAEDKADAADADDGGNDDEPGAKVLSKKEKEKLKKEKEKVSVDIFCLFRRILYVSF